MGRAACGGRAFWLQQMGARYKGSEAGNVRGDKRKSGLQPFARGLHGDGRWPARHFSSDSPSLAVDII